MSIKINDTVGIPAIRYGGHFDTTRTDSSPQKREELDLFPIARPFCAQPRQELDLFLAEEETELDCLQNLLSRRLWIVQLFGWMIRIGRKGLVCIAVPAQTQRPVDFWQMK